MVFNIWHANQSESKFEAYHLNKVLRSACYDFKQIMKKPHLQTFFEAMSVLMPLFFNSEGSLFHKVGADE